MCICAVSCGHQKIVLAPDSVESVKVFRGEPYFRDHTITNRDTIRQICTALQLAKPVSLDTVNIHNTIISCFIDFKTKGDGRERFIYTITVEDGKILWYKAHRYQLDTLNQYLR